MMQRKRQQILMLVTAQKNYVKFNLFLGNSLQEDKLYEYNARNQITLWGPKGEITDYANKQWAGDII